MLCLPFPDGSNAKPTGGSKIFRRRFVKPLGMPESPTKESPAGALVKTLLVVPALNASGENDAPLLAVSTSGKKGSHRRPTCTFKREVRWISSWP